MTTSNQDETKGRIKESVGAISGNDELKREGQRDQASAGIKERLEDAVDKVKDVFSGDDKDKRD